MNFTRIITYIGCFAVLLCSQTNAQETDIASVEKPTVEAVADAVAKVANTEDGVLRGNVFTDENGVKTPVNAKMTLTSDGVVVDSVEADEEGSFAFEGIEPGSYQLLGSADGYVGGQAYDVQPYTGSVGGCSSCSLGLQSVEAPYSEAVCQAPASACGGGCGCAGGGGGGFLGGGGGILNGRRLLALGAVGGIIAIAAGDDDDDDMASADE